MLSDIGEVTEAESTPGVGVRRIQNRLAKSGGSPVRSSPTVPYQGLTKRSKAAGHKRTVSMESDSTVTTEGPTEGVFEDFDDTVSVDESAFQGDDEESVVDEGYRRPIVAEVKVMFKKESRELDVRNQTEGEEMSSAVLSRRAEMILANAKMRLDVSIDLIDGKIWTNSTSRIWKEISQEHEARCTSLRRRRCLRYTAAVRYHDLHLHPHNSA